jgi:hypothetical protein
VHESDRRKDRRIAWPSPSGGRAIRRANFRLGTLGCGVEDPTDSLGRFREEAGVRAPLLSRAKKDFLSTHRHEANIDLPTQRFDTRRDVRGHRRPRAVREKRRVSSELFADGPRSRARDDDTARVGDDNRVEIAPRARGAELIVQRDERIGAAAEAAVVGHGQSLPRGVPNGQKDGAAVSPTSGCVRDTPRKPCETTRAVHLIVPPGGSFRETRRIELDARVLTIGRGASCDVRIDVPGVDEEHAKISALALVAVGPDCAIGDVPLDAGQRRLVASGDEIQVGSVVLALDGDDVERERRPAARIRVVEGQNFGAELVLAEENREYIIGRSPKADLVLEDREVSREHLKVVRRGSGVFLFDQASTRGSWLGRSAVYQGSRIEWERPRMLKVGATVLSLDLPSDARRTPGQASAPVSVPPKVKPPPPVEPPPDLGAPANIAIYHYEAKAPPEAGYRAPEPHASTPPPAGPRTAWKKTAPVIGRTSGLLLLALCGIAIVGVLFVVFSLME